MPKKTKNDDVRLSKKEKKRLIQEREKAAEVMSVYMPWVLGAAAVLFLGVIVSIVLRANRGI